MNETDSIRARRPPLLSWALAAARGLGLGALAGAAALSLDALLALLVADAPLETTSLQGDVMAVYLGLGALAGAVVALCSRLGTRAESHRLHAARLFGWALFLPYLVPTWERLDAVLGGLGAACVTLAGIGLWLLALRKASGHSRWTPAVLIAAPALSILLGVHRGLLPEPLAPKSLIFSSVVVVVTLGLAGALRSRTKSSTRGVRAFIGAALVAATLVVAAAVVWISSDSSSSQPPGSDEARESLSEVGFDEANRPPHLLLLTIDTLRLDVFEDVASTTPEGLAFRDALAGATFFDQARAPAPWTAPSVATLMTGLLPDEHRYGKRTGDRDRPLAGLPTGIPTLAEGLRAAGYRCEAYVANPLLYPGSGIDRGFDVFRSLEDSSWKMPWVRILFKLRPTKTLANRWIPQMPYLPGEKVADVVERRLPKPDETRSTPYFVWVHLMDPHYPYLRHDWTVRPDSHRGRYRGEVRYALRQATRVVESFRSAGLWDESVAVFTSDHGEMFPADQHGEVWARQGGKIRKMGHGHSLHTEVVRVPLALRVPPGVETPLAADGPLSLGDLPRALETALGVPLGLRSSGAGRNLTLSGTEWGPKQRGLVYGNWKLIHFPNGESGDRLYRHERDPTERWNLATRRPGLVRKLRQRLDAAWQQMKPHEAGEAGELDEETLQRLKALGYLED